MPLFKIAEERAPVDESKSQTASSLASGINEGSWLQYAKDMAKSGDEAWIEKLWNYYATKDSEQTARDWTARREDTAYSRLIKDLEGAGITPYVLSSGTPVVSGSTGKAYSGTELVSRSNNEATNQRSKEDSIRESSMRLFQALGVALMWLLLA